MIDPMVWLGRKAVVQSLFNTLLAKADAKGITDETIAREIHQPLEVVQGLRDGKIANATIFQLCALGDLVGQRAVITLEDK